jgi:hypothetical protein
MAKDKNSGADQNREVWAREIVREVFQRSPLTLPSAIEGERKAQQEILKELGERLRAPDTPRYQKWLEYLFTAVNNGSATDNEMAHVLALAKRRPEAFDDVLRTLHAGEVERHFPPSAQRDHLLRLLLRPNRPPSEYTQHRGGINGRNFSIALAVYSVVKFAGLHPTRNRAQRDKDGAHSACSLVADELKKFGFHRCGEDAVEKIWQQQADEIGKMASEK